MDNIFNERLGHSVKVEEVYLNHYQSPREAGRGIKRSMHFYNQEPPRQSFAFLTTAHVYAPTNTYRSQLLSLSLFKPLPGMNIESRGR